MLDYLFLSIYPPNVIAFKKSCWLKSVEARNSFFEKLIYLNKGTLQMGFPNQGAMRNGFTNQVEQKRKSKEKRLVLMLS